MKRFKSERDSATVAGFEDGHRGPHTKECRCPPEAGNEKGLPVPQPQEQNSADNLSEPGKSLP